MDPLIDYYSGEIVSATLTELSAELERVTTERDALHWIAEHAQLERGKLLEALAEARSDVTALRTRLATATCPVGRMRMRGRVVNMPGGALAVVADGGRYVRLAQAPGEGAEVPDGAPVVAEALLDARRGWTLWRIKPLSGDDALAVPEVPAALREKLTTPPPKSNPTSHLGSIDEVEKDAGTAAADLRRHAHHVSSISLHVVLVRHRRGTAFALTDEMAAALNAETADVVERLLGWKVLGLNTGSLDANHRHDHLHLAVSHVDATKPIGASIGRIKATTSRRMRARFPELAALEHFWSAGYYAGSFGGPNSDAVLAYVAAQEQ